MRDIHKQIEILNQGMHQVDLMIGKIVDSSSNRSRIADQRLQATHLPAINVY